MSVILINGILRINVAYQDESAIWRPRDAVEGTKVGGIAVNKSRTPVYHNVEHLKSEAHCSANASITLKQPSSEMAATYLTSGENTKSVS